MNVKKYIKKPVTIEAMPFTKENWNDLKIFTNNYAYNLNKTKDKATCLIRTLEGNMIATEGDYIIKGIKGEFYPCKPDIFKDTYDEII